VAVAQSVWFARGLRATEFVFVCLFYDPVMKEVMYNNLIEFGIPMTLVKLIKIGLNETYNKVCIGKHLCDSFSIQNGLKW
jgi:hypothetical protein